jgi:hypothetical protein
MYTNKNVTDAPTSSTGNRKSRLMASSAVLGDAALYPVQFVFKNASVALFTFVPK